MKSWDLPRPDWMRIGIRLLLVLWAVGLFVLWTAPFVTQFGAHALVDCDRATALAGKVGFAAVLDREWPDLTPTRLATLPYRHGNYSFVEFFLLSPVAVMPPFPVPFNLMVMLICVGNALACYVLFLHLGRSPGIALGAACLGAWNPHTIEYVRQGHVDVLMIFPLAMYFLCLLRWLDGPLPTRENAPVPARGFPWAAMAWLGIMGMIYWYWTYLALAATVLLVLERLVARSLSLREVGRLVGALVLLGIVLAPFALGMLVQVGGTDRYRPRPPGRPFPTLEQARIPTAEYYGDFRIVRSSIPVSEYLRDTPPLLLLVLVGILFRWRGKLGWLAILLLFLVLSWGPYPSLGDGPIRVGSSDLRSPVYCVAYQYLPMFSRFHFADRFRAFYFLALGALLSLVLADLRAAGRVSAAGAGVVGAVLTVLLYGWAVWANRPALEGPKNEAIPIRTMDVAALASRSGQRIEGPAGAVVQVPFGTGNSDVMDWTGLHQLLRGREVRCEWRAQLYNGPATPHDLPRENSLLDALCSLSSSSTTPPVRPSPGDIQAAMGALGFRYVAVDRALFLRIHGSAGSDMYDATVRFLGDLFGPPLQQGNASALFEIRPAVGLQAPH